METTETVTKRVGAPSKFSQEVIDQVVAAMRAGETIPAVAAKFGMSESSVVYYRNKHGLTVKRVVGASSSAEQKLLTSREKEVERLTTRRTKLVEEFNAARERLDTDIRAAKSQLTKLRAVLGIVEESTEAQATSEVAAE